MKFFPKEICDKFLEMGCNPDHELAYDSTGHVRQLPHNSVCGWALDEFGPYIPAFHPWDFIGTSEQARKNAEILWPSDISGVALRVDENVQGYFFTKGLNAGMKPSVFHRHEAIDFPDAMEYIMRFII